MAKIAPRIVATVTIADPARKRVEEAWLNRLNSLRARYHELRDERARIMEHAPDCPKPHGNLTRVRALRKENAVLREYKRVLTTFTDLIMHGTVPGEKAFTGP